MARQPNKNHLEVANENTIAVLWEMVLWLVLVPGTCGAGERDVALLRSMMTALRLTLTPDAKLMQQSLATLAESA